MKRIRELTRGTVLMQLAWHRGADRMAGRHPDEFKRSRKGNHLATSGAVLIAIYTPKFRRKK